MAVPAEIRTGSKSPQAFRTISEVANGLEVAQHVLRFWESKFPQIKPMKRGGGRRYYRPEDVDLLRGIQQLLYADGYTIKGVQRLLRERGARSLIAAVRGGEGLDVWLVAPAVAAAGPRRQPDRQAAGPDDPKAAQGEANREALAAVLAELVALRALLKRSP